MTHHGCCSESSPQCGCPGRSRPWLGSGILGHTPWYHLGPSSPVGPPRGRPLAGCSPTSCPLVGRCICCTGNTGSRSEDTSDGFYTGRAFCSYLQKTRQLYYVNLNCALILTLLKLCVWGTNFGGWLIKRRPRSYPNGVNGTPKTYVTHRPAPSCESSHQRSPLCRGRTWSSCWADSPPGRAADRVAWEVAWKWRIEDKLRCQPVHHPASGMRQLEGTKEKKLSWEEEWIITSPWSTVWT